MGFWSFVGGCLSTLVRAGGALLGGIAKVATAIVGLQIKILTAGMRIISSFAELFCGKPKEETPEELGEKALQSDKKPEDFASTEEYIKHLRNDIQLDREKMAKLTPDERLERQALGTSIYMKQIEDQFETKLPPRFFETIGKLEMSAPELKTYMDSFKSNGLSDMGKMSDYLKGKLEPKEVPQVAKAIKEGAAQVAEQHQEKKSEADINSDILEMAATMRNTDN